MSGVFKDEHPDTPNQTKQLAEKYLQQPHTMCLLVIDGRTRIRNDAAVELIQKHKKEEWTIGVLTKSDRTGDFMYRKDRPFHELMNKLDGTSTDYIHLPQGYIAVKNRDLQFVN